MNRSVFGWLLVAGVILLIIGLVGVAVPYVTTQQTKDVASIGDLKLQTTESKSYAIPSVVSFGALGVGIVLIGAGLYRRA